MYGSIAFSNSTTSKPPLPSDAQPVIHKPCSLTLGKFHDSVNHSLTIHKDFNDNHKRSNQRNYQMFNAKDKYKYMLRLKTYVDETLFETGSKKYKHDFPNDFNIAPSANQLSHALMANITSIHSPSPKTSIVTSRSEQQSTSNITAQRSQSANNRHIKSTTKPWMP